MNKTDLEHLDKVVKFRGIDRKGEHLYSLTFISPEYKDRSHIFWKCKCDCGNITYARYDQVSCGQIKSCGCVKESKRLHINDVIGNIKILDKLPDNKFHQKMYLCKCSCGNTFTTTGQKLKTGHTQSCGKCNHKRDHKIMNRKVDSRIYSIWLDIKTRCCNINSKNYKNYGARGITVCDSWKNSFDNFYNDMYKSYQEHVDKFGEKQTTIDRIDVNGNYELDNCRWATLKEQANNKTNTLFVTYNSVTKSVGEWADITGIPITKLRRRIFKDNWDIERAFTEK